MEKYSNLPFNHPFDISSLVTYASRYLGVGADKIFVEFKCLNHAKSGGTVLNGRKSKQLFFNLHSFFSTGNANSEAYFALQDGSGSGLQVRPIFYKVPVADVFFFDYLYFGSTNIGGGFSIQYMEFSVIS